MNTIYPLNCPDSRALAVILSVIIGVPALFAQEPSAAPPVAVPPPAAAPAPVPVPSGPTDSSALEPLPPPAIPGAVPAAPPPAKVIPGGAPVPPSVTPLAPGAMPGLTPVAPKVRKSAATVTGRTPPRPSKIGPPAAAGLPAPITGVGVAGTSLDLELSGDAQAAAQQYREFISAFDAQREAAAHAVFGLGEAYRKLGRVDEARAQYGRVLREFVDFPELARQSQKLLSENQPSRASGANDSRPAGSAEALQEERKLVEEELALLQDELKSISARVSTGVEPSASALPIQREILQLKQRLVRLRSQEGQSALQGR